jgi:hypothetical protein
VIDVEFDYKGKVRKGKGIGHIELADLFHISGISKEYQAGWA